MLYRFIIVSLLISFCSGKTQAQVNKNDAALWVNFYLEKRINKFYAVHLNQQNRWNNNMTQFAQAYLDVGVTRKFSKHFKVMFDYVYIERTSKEQLLQGRHQYYVAGIFSKKIRKFKFSDRTMFQGQNNLAYFSSENRPLFYLRNKGTIKYEFNKYITAYVAEELFLPTNNYQIKGLDRSRSFMGIFLSQGKNYELELYMAYQRELNPNKKRKQDFIYGMGYSIKI